MKPFKILFLPTLNTPQTYYRMASFAKYMNRQRNVEAVVYQYDPKEYESCLWEWQLQTNYEQRDYFYKELVEPADIVVYQKVHSAYALAMIMSMKHHFDKPFILEMDDYLMNVPIYNGAADGYQPGTEFLRIAEEQIGVAHVVIAATPWLARKCEDLNPHALVVPNAIDFEIWDKVRPAKPHKRIRIGWVGGASHREDLALLRKPLKRIFKIHSNVDFYCIHGVPEFFKDQPRIKAITDWHTIDKYPQALTNYGFDIGVAPLLDNEFNRAKSNLRWLEYSAMGIPTVASAVEPFKESIIHGRTGYLVHNEDEWVQYLDKLIRDEKKRQQIGEAAQKKVRKSYNTATVTVEYLRLLKRMVG